MFQLKNTCKGWSGMQAAIKKKKTVYHTIRIKIEGKPGDYYELVQALSVKDSKLTPTEVEGIKNFDKNDKENYPLNDSIIHVDFMIGTKDLKVVGIPFDSNEEIVIMENGEFAI